MHTTCYRALKHLFFLCRHSCIFFFCVCVAALYRGCISSLFSCATLFSLFATFQMLFLSLQIAAFPTPMALASRQRYVKVRVCLWVCVFQGLLLHVLSGGGKLSWCLRVLITVWQVCTILSVALPPGRVRFSCYFFSLSSLTSSLLHYPLPLPLLRNKHALARCLFDTQRALYCLSLLFVLSPYRHSFVTSS